jgi:hypothetical protein
MDLSSKLTSIDAIDIDKSSIGGDKNVVLAWMDLNPGDLTLTDEELGLRHDRHLVVTHFHHLLLHTVGPLHREDTESAVIRVLRSELIAD